MSDVLTDRTFGGWLRYFRIKESITLRQMATKLKMDAGNYSKIERSILPPPRSSEGVRRLIRPLPRANTSLMLDLACSYHLAEFHKRWK